MYRNVLFNTVSSQWLKPKCIKKLKDELGFGKCFLIVGHKEDEDGFSKYAETILQEDCVRGRYDKYAHLIDKDLDVLDDQVIRQCEPFMMEVMMMQRRFEGIEKYRFSDLVSEHYHYMMSHIQFWNNFLDCQETDLIIFSNIPHESFDYIIYRLARMKNIRCSFQRINPIPGRSMLLDAFEEEYHVLTDEFERIKSGAEEVELKDDVRRFYERLASENVEENKEVYKYTIHEKFMKRYSYRFPLGEYVAKITDPEDSKIKKGMKLLGKLYAFPLFCVKNRKKYSYRRKVWKETKKIHRIYGSVAEMPKQNEKYIYYAMQYIPELTSCPMGGGLYVDQRIPIGILAKSIPEDWHIYVKIHPVQLAHAFEEDMIFDIRKIGKVRLISEEADNFGLMMHAEAIATLTGSCAWESQFLDKPVLVFGYSEKNSLPAAVQVRTVEECKKAVRDIEANRIHTTKQELKLFCKALENISYISKPENYCEALIEKLKNGSLSR